MPFMATMIDTASSAIFLVSGVIYIAMGILRLGFVTIFLSHAVVSGFTTGAAVIIGLLENYRYRRRIASLRQRQDELESAVVRRTREIQRQKEQIEVLQDIETYL